jgi:eukaryotic-like serine/threonine-protein kinase
MNRPHGQCTKPGAEDLLLSAQSDTEAYFGRIEKARNLSRLAVESARNNNAKETAGLWQANEAAREAQFGNTVAAHQQAQTALSLSRGRHVRVLMALALARSGNVSQAQKLADQLTADLPLDTLIQSYWLPTIRAEIELYSGKAKTAIELLHSTIPYELGDDINGVWLYAVYVRGEAYLRSQKSEAATSEFQKILQHRGIVQNCLLGALAHLGLARAYSMQGDAAKARTAYQDFFALW